jgi:hypothetical protein
MLDRPWLNILTESADQQPEVYWFPCEGWEDGHVILPAVADQDLISEALITEGPSEVIAKLRKKGWSTAGRSLGRLMKEIDPRFINHKDHLERLTKGGTRPDGTAFPGGGGLRWGGLVISQKEALLRVLGSYEYKDTQEQYQQTIRFANFHAIAKAAGLTWTERARLLMQDRIKVHCDCPAFRYFHAYAATEKGFALYPELRPSNKTNPEKKGGICKHLHLVLQYLPAQAQSIASDMKAHFGVKVKPKKK